MKEVLLVFLGGGLGSVGRYGLSAWIKPWGVSLHGFPLHTFVVNALGCLVIGLLLGVFSRQENQTLSLLFVTGFCGGFTTFSTFSSECMGLVRGGDMAMAVCYALASLVVCVAFAFVGYSLSGVRV